MLEDVDDERHIQVALLEIMKEVVDPARKHVVSLRLRLLLVKFLKVRGKRFHGDEAPPGNPHHLLGDKRLSGPRAQIRRAERAQVSEGLRQPLGDLGALLERITPGVQTRDRAFGGTAQAEPGQKVEGVHRLGPVVERGPANLKEARVPSSSRPINA